MQATAGVAVTSITREKAELFALHAGMCARGLELMKRKNADYSKADPLGNFMVAESLQACSAENGIIVRMSDKLSRLVSILSKGTQEVKDESVEDTIIDIINYAVLLRAVILKKSPANPCVKGRPEL